MDLVLDLEVLTDRVYASTLMTNVSSGTDLAMRYFLEGDCRDENFEVILPTPHSCRHLHHEEI